MTLATDVTSLFPARVGCHGSGRKRAGVGVPSWPKRGITRLAPVGLVTPSSRLVAPAWTQPRPSRQNLHDLGDAAISEPRVPQPLASGDRFSRPRLPVVHDGVLIARRLTGCLGHTTCPKRSHPVLSDTFRWRRICGLARARLPRAYLPPSDAAVITRLAAGTISLDGNHELAEMRISGPFAP
jgi:hypothetical protein